jgi:ankyrin repeat protein
MADQKLNDELLTAAEKGDTGKVRALLAKGADVNAKDSDGATPLMLAPNTSGHTETVHTLRSAGADVNVPGAGGLSR